MDRSWILHDNKYARVQFQTALGQCSYFDIILSNEVSDLVPGIVIPNTNLKFIGVSRR